MGYHGERVGTRAVMGRGWGTRAVMGRGGD